MVLFLPQTGQDAVISVTGVGYVVPGKVAQQRVEATVNGNQIGSFTLTKPQTIETFTLTIPAADFSEGQPIQISLSLPDAASPHVLGTGSDARTLGFYVHSLELQ